MGAKTSIGWTDSTRNFWMGCSKVHEVCPVTGKIHVELGVCEFCYVERTSRIFNFTFAEIKYTNWQAVRRDLLSWEPRKIFPNDFSDWMHKAVPDLTIEKMIDLINEVDKHHLEKFGQVHQYQWLTKRAARLEQFFSTRAVKDNFWIGVSIGNKASLYYLNHLKRVNARIKWISFEPLIEDLEDDDRAYRESRFVDPKYEAMYQGVFDDEGLVNLQGIHWIVIGGESGDNPRPMQPAWAERLIAAGKKYGCAIYFKQLGGKGRDGAGGNIINGKQHLEFPKYQ